MTMLLVLWSSTFYTPLFMFEVLHTTSVLEENIIQCFKIKPHHKHMSVCGCIIVF